MKEKYVILLEPTAGTRGTSIGGAAAAPRVEVDELDERASRAMRRRSDVAAIAPAMPMRLIEPVATDVPAAPSAGGVAWGITAVGADTSPFDGTGIVVGVHAAQLHHGRR
jgi:hypothetical protein